MLLHFFPEAAWKEYYPSLGPMICKIAYLGSHGVELFFVLSGFLITGILLDKQGDRAGSYFMNFYARRTVRIFPLYYGTLFILFFGIPLFAAFDPAANAIAAKQHRLWFYLTNIPLQRPNWDGSDVFWVGHFWSLAVEEHFYVIWPFVVYICSRNKLKKVCYFLLALGCTARFSNMIYGDSSFWFFKWSTISKIDGLVVGALLAILVRDANNHDKLLKYAKSAAWILGFAFFGMALLPRRMKASMGYYDLFFEPVMVFFFCSLIILALQEDNRSKIRNLMENSVLRWFGQYSYGLYVIHGMLRPAHLKKLNPDVFIALVKFPIAGLVLHLAFFFGVSIVLALVSWHCYEKHFLKLKTRFK